MRNPLAEEQFQISVYGPLSASSYRRRLSLISSQLRQTSGNGRDGEAHVGERWRPFWTHSYPVCGPVTPLSKETYLSEMSAPVYGRPAVEGVLHRQVSLVWGALKEGAQGTDISIPARPVEREAAV